MKIGLIGDPHIGNHKIFGNSGSGPEVPWSPTPGLNTRAQYCLKALCWAFEQCVENYVSKVCILGDMIHNFGVLSAPIIEGVHKLITHSQVLGVKVYMLAGNHDIDGNGVSALRAFEKKNFITCNEPEFIHTGPNIGVIPYLWTLDDPTFLKAIDTLDRSLDVLLTHAHIKGAVHGSHEFRPSGGLSPSSFSGQVFSGHYHKWQQVGDRATYTGALLQHNFGEEDYTPGFVIWNSIKPSQHKFITTPADIAPRFYSVDYDETDIPGRFEDDYYRILVPADVDIKEVRSIKQKLRNSKVVTVPISSEVRSRVLEYFDTRESDCLDDGGHIDDEESGSSARITLEDVMEAYAFINTDNEDRADRLLELGHDIITAVSSRG